MEKNSVVIGVIYANVYV